MEKQNFETYVRHLFIKDYYFWKYIFHHCVSVVMFLLSWSRRLKATDSKDFTRMIYGGARSIFSLSNSSSEYLTRDVILGAVIGLDPRGLTWSPRIIGKASGAWNSPNRKQRKFRKFLLQIEWNPKHFSCYSIITKLWTTVEDGASSLADEESLDGKYRIESWPRQFISRQGAKHNTSQLWLIYKNSSAGAFFASSSRSYFCFLSS